MLRVEPDPAEMLSIEHVYADVARRLGENGDRLDPDWPWERGLLARSALYEIGRARLLENWETLQASKRAAADARRRR